MRYVGKRRGTFGRAGENTFSEGAEKKERSGMNRSAKVREDHEDELILASLWLRAVMQFTQDSDP